MGTRKARTRRLKENFFNLYCNGKGIDIGCADRPLTNNIDKWDLSINPRQDATYMHGIPDEHYDFVYSSHCLEDLIVPNIALQNWWRIIKPGGYIILYLPHRDLYEMKRTLPSNGNPDHKYYFLIDRDEPLCTIGLIPFITRTLTRYDIIYVKKCDYDYHVYIENSITVPDGEFSIETVIRKLKPGEYNY